MSPFPRVTVVAPEPIGAHAASHAVAACASRLPGGSVAALAGLCHVGREGATGERKWGRSGEQPTSLCTRTLLAARCRDTATLCRVVGESDVREREGPARSVDAAATARVAACGHVLRELAAGEGDFAAAPEQAATLARIGALSDVGGEGAIRESVRVGDGANSAPVPIAAGIAGSEKGAQGGIAGERDVCDPQRAGGCIETAALARKAVRLIIGEFAASHGHGALDRVQSAAGADVSRIALGGVGREIATGDGSRGPRRERPAPLGRRIAGERDVRQIELAARCVQSAAGADVSRIALGGVGHEIATRDGSRSPRREHPAPLGRRIAGERDVRQSELAARCVQSAAAGNVGRIALGGVGREIATGDGSRSHRRERPAPLRRRIAEKETFVRVSVPPDA